MSVFSVVGEFTLRGVEQVKSQINGVTTQAQQTATTLNNGKTSLATFGDKMKTVGNTCTQLGKTLMPISLLTAGMGTAIVKTSAEFESGMSKVQAISGATGEDLVALTNKAKEMGAKTKFSASESAEAMQYMAMAGWKTNDMLNGLEGVMNLASASGEDLATVSDIVTDSLTAFGLSASDSSHFADVLASASSNSNTNVSMMGETFKYVAPLAGALGYSVEDTAVAIGIMANAGIKGSQAGTTLRSMFSRLASPPKECADAMDKLGISITNTDGTMKPLNQLLGEMRTAFDGLGEAEKSQMAKSIAGQEAMSGLLALVNASDEDFAKLTDSIDNCSGSAEQMASVMNDNLSGKVTLLKSQFEGLCIQLGEVLVPIAMKVVDGLSQIMTWLSNLSPTMQTVIVVVGVVLALLGPLLMFIGQIALGISSIIEIMPVIAAALSTISAPIVLIVGLVAGFVAILVEAYNTSDEFRTRIDTAFNSVHETISTILDSLQVIISGFIDFVEQIWGEWGDEIMAVAVYIFEGMAQYINGILTVIAGIIQVVTSLISGDWEGVWEGIKMIFNGIWLQITATVHGKTADVKNKISEAWNTVKSTTSSIWESIRTAIENPINRAKEAVQKAIDKIKSVMNFSWKLPHLSLPTISVSGSFSLKPPSAPHFSLSWHKDGGIFDVATLIPSIDGRNVHGVGEAGPEAITPIAVLKDYMREVNDESFSSLAPLLLDVRNLLQQYLPNTNQQIVLDNGVLVGQMIGNIDTQLGNISKQKERGFSYE